MTLADYSLSDVVFTGLASWKNVLADAVNLCSNNDFNNSQQQLAAAVQVLEEFINVAKSELADWPAQDLCRIDSIILFLSCFAPPAAFSEREGNCSSKEKLGMG